MCHHAASAHLAAASCKRRLVHRHVLDEPAGHPVVAAGRAGRAAVRAARRAAGNNTCNGGSGSSAAGDNTPNGSSKNKTPRPAPPHLTPSTENRRTRRSRPAVSSSSPPRWNSTLLRASQGEGGGARLGWVHQGRPTSALLEQSPRSLHGQGSARMHARARAQPMRAAPRRWHRARPAAASRPHLTAPLQGSCWLASLSLVVSSMVGGRAEPRASRPPARCSRRSAAASAPSSSLSLPPPSAARRLRAAAFFRLAHEVRGFSLLCCWRRRCSYCWPAGRAARLRRSRFRPGGLLAQGRPAHIQQEQA